MNRIYKVIWSKVRNAYVVVSELAKSHGKDKSERISSRQGRAALENGLLTVCMAGGLLLGTVQPVWAGNSVDEGTASGTHALAVGSTSIATGEEAVAVGSSQATADYTIAIGDGAVAMSSGEIAIGKGAGNAADNRTNDNNAISIGTSARSREAGGVALGNAALANLGKSVAIGDSAKANNADSIAIGSGATASGSVGSIALGSNSSVGRASGATGGPRWNTSNDIGGRWYTWASAKNAAKGTDGTWTTTIDPKSTVWQSNLGAVSIGTDGLSGTTYTRQLTGLAAGTQDTDAVNVAQWKNTMLATIGDAKEDSNNTRYGTDNVARNVTRLVNEYLTLTGAADDGTTLNKDQLTTDANIGTIVGDNKITFRLAKNITGLDSVTAGNTKMESKGITIINPDDNTKNITLDGSTGRAVIGGVTVGHVNDGELETSSHTVVPAGNYVYNLTNTKYDPTDYVSGRAATEDQLHQLGSQVTGDINTINQVLGDGTFGLSADDDASTTTNLGNTIKVKGDSANITTKVDGTDLQIELNKNLNLGDTGSVTMGNTLLNGSGLTLSGTGENSKIQISQGNVSMGGQQIHNVANGTADTDAVNLSQLNEIKNAGANGGFGLAADDGNSVKKKLGETVTVKGDGTNISTKVDKGAIQVELNKDINLGTDGSVIAGNTTINGDGVSTNKVTVGDITITDNGINGGQQQITNIGSGINGQVYDTNTAGQENWNNAASIGDVHTIIGQEAGKAAEAVKAKSGKNITVDADNKVNLNDDITLGDGDDASKQVKIDGNKAQITLGGKTVLGNQEGGGASPDAGSYLTGLGNKTWDASNIQSGRAATEDQLKVVDDKIAGGRKFTGDDGQQLTVGLGQDLSLTGGAQADNLSDGNIGVVKNGDSGLSVKLSKDLNGLTSVTTGNTTMTSDGITIKTSDSSKGGDIKLSPGDVSMGGSQIHDVAPGTQGTDAVNKNQLDSAVNQVGRSITKLDARVDRVGANAAALAALHPLDFDPDDKLDFAVGAGSYSGANAVALGAFYRPNEDTMISLGGSVGGGENMVNVGATFKLGQHNHVSNSRVAMAKEIRSLKELVAKQDGEMQQLKTLMNQMAGRTVLKVDKDTLFPDIPENHWAYDYVTKLAKAGIVEGYPDGEFKGDRMMTRYEFAALVYRAIMAGAGSNPALDQDGTLGRLVKEFDGELKYIRIDVIEKDKHGNPSIERVRTVEDSKKHYGK